MEQRAIERAMQRAEKRAAHEARALAVAETARARSRHERRLDQCRTAWREAMITFQAFGYDLEGA